MAGDAPDVLIADDDVLLREGLARLLADEGFDVIDQVGNASALLALAHRHRPDLVIVDIRMPPTHTTEGLDVARTIRAEMPDTAILVLSAHAELEQATDLLARGERSGYLLKSRVTDVEEFIAALRRIVDGGAVVDPALVQQLLAARRATDPLEGLSAREREVLALMAEGRSNAAIAKELWVASSTVEKHIRSIFIKLSIPETGDDHRRVLAVIRFLETR
jgi:DNA-binding NarL/FixJ family response regulator